VRDDDALDVDGNPGQGNPAGARNAAGGRANGAAGGRGGAGGFGGGFGRGPARTFGGNTPLTLAAREGHIEAIRALVESGADVNEGNASDKTTPIVTAICNGHYDAAKYLLDHGADPNLKSTDGLAALYAVIDTQWAPVGWSPNPITDQENITYLELMKALLEKGADPNAQLLRKLWFRPTHHDESWINAAGASVFWRAAQATDLKAMHLLIAHGADPKVATNDGVNPLMAAAGLGWNGNFSTQGPDSSLACVQYCLDLGLDATAQNTQGYTAIGGAAYRGDNDLIKLLLAHGAKLDTRTSRGWSITDMANGPSLRSSVPVPHPQTVALLLSLGAPPLTSTADEEILGVIRRRRPAPVAEVDGAGGAPPTEDASAPNSAGAAASTKSAPPPPGAAPNGGK
jgi:ankyrin repeat protein